MANNMGICEEKYLYQVKCEGRIFTTKWCYEGLRECQKFIQEYGRPDKQYKIRTIRKETK